ncbi:ankyrin repeat domain-containing protein 7-like [Ostrea edulis]|uniref:ankyrin repeat domain-containing protein 7-like n=1 Tax=Ostrea edulis TaxID=37623 RepID=UPI002095043E|nr:ankyrin repeat domain-containing protein 7-like [Ostrea edulis]
MKRSKSTSPRNSFTLRHSSSTWSIMSTKRKRKASPTLTRQASTSENLLADINKLDSKGRSLLFLAARCDQPEVAVQLLAAGCDANLADSEGNTPLHEAAECGHKEVVHILLHNGQCDIDAKNVLGQTPVMRAVFNDNQEVVKVLVKAGSDLHHVDHLGKSALMIGLQEGAEKSCLYLIKAGSDVNRTDHEGRSVLFYAVHSSYLHTLNVAKKLFKTGCDIIKNASWLVESKSDENCLLQEDPKFHSLLLSKVGIKEKHKKHHLISSLKCTFQGRSHKDNNKDGGSVTS